MIWNLGKRGEEKILSIWWFLVLSFIGGGIVIGVMIYYSSEISSNKLESEILASRLAECIIKNGTLDFNNEDIFQKCNLRRDAFVKGGNFFFKIEVDGREIKEGNPSFEKNCLDGIIAKHFPRCTSKKEIVFDKGLIKVEILTAVNQKGSRRSINEKEAIEEEVIGND